MANEKEQFTSTKKRTAAAIAFALLLRPKKSVTTFPPDPNVGSRSPSAAAILVRVLTKSVAAINVTIDTKRIVRIKSG